MTRVHGVVLNWNRERDTAECLDSFLAQQGVPMDILLVDNGSADGSGDRLHARYPAVDYLQTGANLGYAGGNNRGMERVLAGGAEWVLVVNNDTVAEADCVRRMLDALEADAGLAAVAPLIVQHDDPSRAWFAGGRLSAMRAMGRHDVTMPTGHPDGVIPCTFLSGCCVLFRASVLRTLGLFREDFWLYVDDVEWSWRFGRGGWKLAVVPGARLSHKAPPVGSPDTPLQIRLRDRNRRRMVRDLYPAHLRLAFAIWFWPTRLVHLARFALRGDWPRARAIVAGMTEA